MDQKHITTIIEILLDNNCIHLADCLELIGGDNLEAIAVMVDNMRLTDLSESRIAATVVHDVSGLLENEEGFVPRCNKYRMTA